MNLIRIYFYTDGEPAHRMRLLPRVVYSVSYFPERLAHTRLYENVIARLAVQPGHRRGLCRKEQYLLRIRPQRRPQGFLRRPARLLRPLGLRMRKDQPVNAGKGRLARRLAKGDLLPVNPA